MLARWSQHGAWVAMPGRGWNWDMDTLLLHFKLSDGGDDE